MKKLFNILMASAICLMAMSCMDRTNKTNNENTLNFEECWQKDYADMLKDCPDTSFHFFYAQAKLSKNINEVATAADVEIIEVQVLFQKNADSTTTYTHTNTGAYVKKTELGKWMECMNIDPTKINLTLDECIDVVGAMDCFKPASDIVVMRCPLAPPFDVYPYYIFGTPRDYMCISSFDGSPVIEDANPEK